jgi:AraC family transcriptional regulator of adaptative response / DNA-3-methyladenine glycosylase II
MPRAGGTLLLLSNEQCHRATWARDPRFDGVFFIGITSTGIYCRPICPARVTLTEHRRFFVSAAAAERSGYRPCLRCRPELAPGRAPVDAVSRLALAAALRIGAGALNGGSVADLARELSVSERHLRRALERQIGVSPVELAQTHRLLLAKRLLADTALPVTHIAFASGFQSLRRFNTVFREHYHLTPSRLRRAAPGRGRRGAARPGALPAAPEETVDAVRLTLAYRAPLDWDVLLRFLERDALSGVEIVRGGRYGRTVCIDGRSGVVLAAHGTPRAGSRPGAAIPATASCPGGASKKGRAGGMVSNDGADSPHVAAGGGGRAGGAAIRAAATHLDVAVSLSLVPVLMPLLARLRQMFDLDAEPVMVDAHLAQGGLAPLVARHRGIRIPGAVDPFEVVLGVLIRGAGESTTAARAATRRVVQELGEPLATGIPGLDRLAPTAARVAEAGAARLETLGVAPHRALALAAAARAVAQGQLTLAPGCDIAAARRALLAIGGVSDRLATAILIRTLYWPDAFPQSDPVLQRAAAVSGPGGLRARAERWRPWRAYAALHLWLAELERCGAAPPAG